ncbi:aconitate hydratase AcnA [Acinetobacter bereziniae]|uniref:aconitate hydratase AcnA n=1 Tax=Acinetobacter bereziniae TaxID=106648 RepID=UPI0019017753|nr:aconitate hydratase AcnA [Acinetobacter bereziniae]MBJ8552988.1 aconitate hydratase AcnA [Acinetobacter bereziniae]MCU4418530.1 aconitate hydratase AcnA [Acinetobacter bereziniae]
MAKYGRINSLNSLQNLNVGNSTYKIFSLKQAQSELGDLSKLPKSLKVLLENLLRFEDDLTVKRSDIQAIVDWQKAKTSDQEIQYRPARVLMQDFTGVPAVVDLAAMRAAVQAAHKDPNIINPLSPVDLVIDHSVMVDHFGTDQAFDENVEIEMQRNGERYQFLRWGQSSFDNFSVVPPGTGICHQVNLEYLAQAVWLGDSDGESYAFPDTLVGTDSHTTMINGLGVLGWGVGGIEAEAAMLGQPISMLIPEVIGFKLTGKLREGITATDLVLTITQMLRKKGVVGKFVEFYGDGLADLPLADRATIANMAPEYGATCGFFPIDEITLGYLRLTGRQDDRIALVEAYCKEQGLWRNTGDEPVFTDTLALDMNTVEASVAGPKRPQDRVVLPDIPKTFSALMELDLKPAKIEKERLVNEGGAGTAIDSKQSALQNEEPHCVIDGKRYPLTDGDVVISAITSCTNTSNPSVMLAAGLLAKKAIEKGLQRKPWVKSSLAPGSKVVTDYLEAAGLLSYLDQLGYNLVGYGCTTCIGNSGPLPQPIEDAIQCYDLNVASVLSGNRNFEGRVHPLVKTNWLASPPLVVAFGLLGTIRSDITSTALGHDQQGQPVYLKDIWPSQIEIDEVLQKVNTQMFHKEYAAVFDGDEKWQAIQIPDSETYEWDEQSTYIRHPPFFEGIDQPAKPIQDILNANILAVLGDSVTTDHISPAGNIKKDSPAGRYLEAQGVDQKDFNSYGSRRGNHEVMMRGTFANIRIKNEMLNGEEGGNTLYIPTGEKLAIYDAAMKYQQDSTPLVIIAGKEYGTGSSRDWAAKGTNLLGVKAVITESFERIHRSNLVGMGVLPLQFVDGQTRQSLNLTGHEQLSIYGLSDDIQPHQTLDVEVKRADGSQDRFKVLCRIDTLNEVEYFKAGGILHYVLRNLIAS